MKKLLFPFYSGSYLSLIPLPLRKIFMRLSLRFYVNSIMLIVTFILNQNIYPWTQTSSLVEDDIVFTSPANGYLCALVPGNWRYPYTQYHYQYAKISSNGELGSWSLVTNPGVIYYWLKAATINDPYLYVSGGLVYTDLGHDYPSKDVQFSRVNSDGSLGQFSYISSLQQPRYAHTLFAHNGYLYALGGVYKDYLTPQSIITTVEYSKINSDGTLAGWQYTSSMSTSFLLWGAWVSDGYLWVVSRNGFFDQYNQVERSFVNSDGSLGPWKIIPSPFTTALYLSNITLGKDGYVYGFYGSYGFYGNGTVLIRTHPYSDGTFSEIETLEPTTGGFLTSAGDYLYDVGAGSLFTDVHYRLADGPIQINIDFFNSSDTTRFAYENHPGVVGQPHIQWLPVYEDSTGVMKLEFTQPYQGVKMTLNMSEWFHPVKGKWYQLKAKVKGDIPKPNNLGAMGVLFNGIPPDETDLNSNGLISVDTTWETLLMFQPTESNDLYMYPQLVIRNNNHSPATFYIDYLEVKEIEPIEIE